MWPTCWAWDAIANIRHLNFACITWYGGKIQIPYIGYRVSGSTCRPHSRLPPLVFINSRLEASAIKCKNTHIVELHELSNSIQWRNSPDIRIRLRDDQRPVGHQRVHQKRPGIYGMEPACDQMMSSSFGNSLDKMSNEYVEVFRAESMSTCRAVGNHFALLRRCATKWSGQVIVSDCISISYLYFYFFVVVSALLVYWYWREWHAADFHPIQHERSVAGGLEAVKVRIADSPISRIVQSTVYICTRSNTLLVKHNKSNIECAIVIFVLFFWPRW